MKTLFILRHAQALSHHDDKQRPLSQFGQKQAKHLAELLDEKNIKIDFTLCSTATRTKETASILQNNHIFQKIIYSDILYLADLQHLYNELFCLDSAIDRALIIGHNPGLFNLAYELAKETDENKHHLSKGFLPCSLAEFKIDIKNWPELSPVKSTLVKVYSPLMS